jgi:uncharacterized SAM-binding protein YcdF (DUF218 family)
VWLLVCVVIAGVVYAYGLTDRAEPADVIIVLGSGLNRNLTPGPSLRNRSEHAAALWRDGYAPMVICSGGYARWATRSEADGCAEVLRENGVPTEAIILEERSRSTEENAVYSQEIMRERGWESALIVSDGYHLLRATWIFSQQGYTDFSTSPATDTPRTVNLIMGVAREVVALHWQVIKTVLGLPFTFVPWV